jgi:molecular chaperone HscB
MDPFETLGVQRRFDIDLAATDKRHRELSRTLHPDRHAAGGASERRYALSKAIEVNEAWRIVKDPIRRAEALFRLAGVAVGETNEPKASAELLMDMMEQRESLAEARDKHDRAAVLELGAEIERRALAAERALAEGLARAGSDSDRLRELLPMLGEMRFYRRFLDEVSELEDAENEEALRRRGVAGG